MEVLRDHLAKLSDAIPSLSSANPLAPTRLARLSQDHIALLETTSESASLHILPLTTQQPSAAHAKFPSTSPIALPIDAHTLIPAHDMLAVIGTRSISIIDRPLSASPTLCSIAAPLFSARPALTVLQAAWAVHAPGFLLVLTSDATLRLFDVISSTPVDTERLRLRVVTNGAVPVSFAFGHGHGWFALSVYVLMADGTIFVVAPIAPIGTRIPHHVWKAMHAAAQARAPADDASSEQSQPTWAVRQSDMQLRFLNHVFERSPAGDMVAVREFKPAPLLFQGPLFVEHDDLNSVPKDDHNKFSSLALLNCGPGATPVLLRSTNDGQVSVLIALEKLEPQWFLSADPAISSSGDMPIEASEEYAACAAQVAPSLLCFEHVSFGLQPVTLVLLGGASHADVAFAVTSSAVYALRLSFISVMSNSDALERTPSSAVIQILSTSTAAQTAPPGNPPATRLVGLAPHYVRAQGPVAIALTADGRLHVSSPVRWVSHFDAAVPSAFLPSVSNAQKVWTAPRPSTGNRAFACMELGKEMSEILKTVQKLEERAGGRLTDGLLGRVSEISNFSSVLEELEGRVALYTGSSDGPGIADNLGELAMVLSTFGKTLTERAQTARTQCADVEHAVGTVSSSEMYLRRKLARVDEVNALLVERVHNLMALIESGRWEMSPAEVTRLGKLKERSRRLAFVRGRVMELSMAVKKLQARGSRSVESSPGRERVNESPGRKGFPGRLGSARKSPRNTNGLSWRMDEEPLARRRPLWSQQQKMTTLQTKDMQRIRVALEKHSADIAKAMELDTTLKKRLAVT